MKRLLLTLGLVLVAYAYAPSLDVRAYAPGDMPPNLAAYELADEPDYAAAKLATMRIDLPNGGVCSGTAIGHHKVLTARHCVRSPDGFRFNTRTARILKVEFDAHDGAILTTDLYFKHVAKFGPRPAQGAVVFSHGNPSSTPDILLLGRVAGWATYGGADDVMLLDRNDWYGCSGAAVFDTEGRIVGVVNAIFPWPNQGWRLTAVFPLTFTAEQLL